MNIDSDKINPLTYTQYSENYYKIQKALASKDLPMYRKDAIAELSKLLDENDIVILKSETGSGKTIAVPINVVRHYNYRGRFVITQPRTVITKSNADFIAAQLDVQLGSYVGFKYKDTDEISRNTILTIMTDGTLLQQFIAKPDYYDVIMIDEFHERNMNIDILMFLFRLFLRKYYEAKAKGSTAKKPKFMLLSATINEQKYVDYFKIVPEISIGVMVSARGKAFNVTKYFIGDKLPDGSTHNYKEPDEIVDWLLSKNNGDILVFLPTVGDVLSYAKDFSAKNVPNLLVGTLYAKQDKETTEKYRGKTTMRRLLFSTNVAQVGLTIDGLMHVVDTGTRIGQYYDTPHSVFELRRENIGKNDAIQRFGRAGRTNDGFAYALYTKAEFDGFIDREEPQIQRTNACTILINYMKATGLMSVAAEYMAQLIDPISRESINFAKRVLLEYNYVLGDRLTNAGKMIGEFDVDYDLGALVIWSFYYKVHKYVIIIAAMMATERSFLRHIDARNIEKAHLGKAILREITNPYGDHYAMYIIFADFYNNFHKFFAKIGPKALEMMEVWKKSRAILTNFPIVLSKINIIVATLNKYINKDERVLIDKLYEPTKEFKKLKGDAKIWALVGKCMLSTWSTNIGRQINAGGTNYFVSGTFPNIVTSPIPFDNLPAAMGCSQINITPGLGGQNIEMATRFAL